MRMTIFGSGKYFTKLQTIELRLTLSKAAGVNSGEVKVLSYENDLAVVEARMAPGSQHWPKWASDTVEAIGRFFIERNDLNLPSDEMFDAWNAASAIVWRRACAQAESVAA